MKFDHELYTKLLKSSAAQQYELSDIALRAIPLLDLTSLNSSDDAVAIHKLCQSAHTPLMDVAAICVFRHYLAQVKSELAGSRILLATVVNFPHGAHSVDETCEEIRQALASGADEIDVAMPYELFLNDQFEKVKNYLSTCKKACGYKTMKVILETALLKSPESVFRASQLAIEAGANFIKTSTGKIGGATPEAAAAILMAIKGSGKPVGIKISGSVKTTKQLIPYFAMTEQMMGDKWIRPSTFRIGASSLLSELLLDAE